MRKAEKGTIEKTVGAYFKEFHQMYTGGTFREESFYPALKMLIEECPQFLSGQTGTTVLVLPKETEAGIPDFRIGKTGMR